MGLGKERDSDETDDRVRLRLGKEDDLRICESYSVHTAILQQPAAFSLTLSGGHGAAEVLAKYPPGPGSPFELYIGKKRQFTGELDAPNAHGDAHATYVDMKGRDLMARLLHQDIEGERSFNNATYQQLLEHALKDVGLEGKSVKISNDANRLIRSGANVKVYKQPVTVDEVKSSPTGAAGKFRNTVTAKMGETWHAFLERHFGKLGLFLWNDAEGNFILSRPNGDQEPTFHFYRKRGEGKSTSNVTRFSFTNDTTHRFSEVVIFARNMGKKHGHNHTHGGFVDEEMKALGFDRRRVYRDAVVGSVEEAEFYARRSIAEVNRASWKLVYTISGHSAPTIRNLDERAIVIPDTVAKVDDDELGIHENLYIESVEYLSPPRTSVITMMRPHDLVFGENQALDGAKKAAARAKKKEQQKIRQPISFVRDAPNENTNVHRAAITTVNRK